MFKKRLFKYVGPAMKTRGQYGENVEEGHNLPEDPEGIFVWDSTFGEICVCSISLGLEAGEWIET